MSQAYDTQAGDDSDPQPTPSAPATVPDGDSDSVWDAWRAAGEQGDGAPGSDIEPRADEDDLSYATVEEFVTQFLVEIGWVNLQATNRTWCPEWWRHPAAIVRLEALHRAFEQLRQDPGIGMSTWLRDHLDRHMDVLTDEAAGPFKGCSPDRGHDAVRERVLPCVLAPQGLFVAVQ